MKTLKKTLMPLLAAVILVMTGCKKDNMENGYMAMQMTGERTSNSSPPSDPAITSVLIDITSVEVHYADEAEGNSGWFALHTNAGIYDLLLLQNDITAALAEDTKLPAGHITQIRLVLGSKNSLIIGGDGKVTLTVPSGDNSGLKINVNTTLRPGKHLVVKLLFDADKSIVLEGNGEYKLKPVLEVKSVTEI